MKKYILNNTKTLQKFKPTFLIIFLLYYLISVIETIIPLPIKLWDNKPTNKEDKPLSEQYKSWIKLSLLSFISIPIMKFLTTQWAFNLEYPYHGTIIRFVFKIVTS